MTPAILLWVTVCLLLCALRLTAVSNVYSMTLWISVIFLLIYYTVQEKGLPDINRVVSW